MRTILSGRAVVGIVLGTLLALSMLPITRWIVVPQMSYVAGHVDGAPGRSFVPEQAASRAPNDARVQLALALNYQPTPDERLGEDDQRRDLALLENYQRRFVLDRLRGLARRFPTDPTFIAALLGVEAIDVVGGREHGGTVAFEAASWDRMLERPDLRDVSMTLMLDGGMRTPPGVRRTKRSPHAPSMTPSGLIPASGDRPRGVGMRFDWVIQDAFAA